MHCDLYLIKTSLLVFLQIFLKSKYLPLSACFDLCVYDANVLCCVFNLWFVFHSDGECSILQTEQKLIIALLQLRKAKVWQKDCMPLFTFLMLIIYCFITLRSNMWKKTLGKTNELNDDRCLLDVDKMVLKMSGFAPAGGKKPADC